MFKSITSIPIIYVDSQYKTVVLVSSVNDVTIEMSSVHIISVMSPPCTGGSRTPCKQLTYQLASSPDHG